MSMKRNRFASPAVPQIPFPYDGNPSVVIEQFQQIADGPAEAQDRQPYP